MSFKRQLKCHTLFEVSLTLPYAKQTMTWLCLSKAPRPWSYRGLRNLKKRRALFLDHPGSCSARLWARCVHSSHSVHLCRSSVYHSSRKSLQRLYRHLLNEQVNKWTFAPILEMEETRPREIQVNLSPHILCVCVCVCVSILMSPLWTRMINDVSESGGPWHILMGRDILCEGHWALPFLAWGQHGLEGSRPMAAFWTEVKSSMFHSDSDLGQSLCLGFLLCKLPGMI